MGARVRVFDPAGMGQARPLLENVTYCTTAYECADAVDALVIATEWEQFRALDLERLRDRMACPVVVDLRNIYRPEDMHKHGFAYACVGRALPVPTFAEATLDQLFVESPPTKSKFVVGAGFSRSRNLRRTGFRCALRLFVVRVNLLLILEPQLL